MVISVHKDELIAFCIAERDAGNVVRQSEQQEAEVIYILPDGRRASLILAVYDPGEVWAEETK